jgi:Fic family protein
MVFVRKKRINGHEYFYAVISTREGARVRKIERYIGVKAPTDEDLRRIGMESNQTKKYIDSIHAELETIRKAYQKKRTKDELRQIEEELIITFTYDTNRIEGSSLSYKDTKMILRDGITPQEKPVRDVREAENHRDAYNFLKSKLTDDVTEGLVLELHRILKEGVTEDAGSFRSGQVSVGDLVPVKATRVREHIRALISWYQNNPGIHPLELTAIFHCDFERIHPFFDGNGRVGRLLLNYMLMKKGYPPLIIRNKDRRRYYNALRRADSGNYLYIIKLLFSEMRSMKYWMQ